MNTPIVDFVKQYVANGNTRCHMPGHKGMPLLGCEEIDLTEIRGADSLYEANGIIRRSEQNASDLFGCQTLYSAEGSSQCIRAMLYLLLMHAASVGKPLRILAGRNVHSVFLSATALMDIDVEWLPCSTSYLSCDPDTSAVEDGILRLAPTAVYLTSPDYLGNTIDIAAVAAVCRKHGILLVIDNAHGAYLRFLTPSRHPIDLGAHLCCDSAHKTLPALTGGAYLHIANDAPAILGQQAKQAMAMFGSTSPSYLILQSLDLVNRYLADGYRRRLQTCTEQIAELKTSLIEHGYTLVGEEPLKVTLATKSYGYCGDEFAAALEARGVVCEFFDPDFTVLMLTPENGDLATIGSILLNIPKRPPLSSCPPPPHVCRRVMKPHDVLFSDRETVDVQTAEHRVLAAVTVGCPPAVPIVMCGEVIDRAAMDRFAYYGITTCTVVKNPV